MGDHTQINPTPVHATDSCMHLAHASATTDSCMHPAFRVSTTTRRSIPHPSNKHVRLYRRSTLDITVQKCKDVKQHARKTEHTNMQRQIDRLHLLRREAHT